MRLGFILLATLTSFFVNAQKSEFKQWVSLSSENDFLGLAVTTDRYYSYGERLDFLTQLGYDGTEYDFLNVRIMLEGYTPKYKGKVEPEKFKRPFFGWLHAEVQKVESDNKNYWKYGVDVGISGPSAMAGDYQNWYHEKLISDRFVEGWENQTPDKLGVNGKLEYRRSLTQGNHHRFMIGAENSLGNIFTYTSPTVNYQFTTINSNHYLPYNYAKSKKGNFTLDLGFGLRYELYNATLQGEFFSQSDNYLNDEFIYRTLLDGEIGMRYSVHHFAIYLNNSFNSKRVQKNDFHNTGIFGIAYQW